MIHCCTRLKSRCFEACSGKNYRGGEGSVLIAHIIQSSLWLFEPPPHTFKGQSLQSEMTLEVVIKQLLRIHGFYLKCSIIRKALPRLNIVLRGEMTLERAAKHLCSPQNECGWKWTEELVKNRQARLM